MPREATRTETTCTPQLYLAMDSGEHKWKVAFAPGLGQAPRLRTLEARDLSGLATEIRKAKERFDLAGDAPVVSCYEAGRDGFWLHRALCGMSVSNTVVDSSSIEVPRRARRAKSDKLDAGKLLVKLMRYHAGDEESWKVVRVPTPAQEDMRQLHRELRAVKRERTRSINRVKALLATQGIAAGGRCLVPREITRLRAWNGEPLRQGLVARLTRETASIRGTEERMRVLERDRKALLRNSPDRAVAKVRKLMKLRGIGVESAWVFVMEFFAWRQFRNVREVASLAGLCPTPYGSGDLQRELGISKAGNRLVRSMIIEIAWGWLRYQPQSELSLWYRRRFADGPRHRRIGIVALARKLLVALWKYVERDELPAGAMLRS